MDNSLQIMSDQVPELEGLHVDDECTFEVTGVIKGIRKIGDKTLYDVSVTVITYDDVADSHEASADMLKAYKKGTYLTSRYRDVNV